MCTHHTNTNLDPAVLENALKKLLIFDTKVFLQTAEYCGFVPLCDLVKILKVIKIKRKIDMLKPY